MDRAAAIAAIQALFAKYRAARAGDIGLLQMLSDGKLYEMYVLSDLVDELTSRGFKLSFVGTSLKFKGSPGMIKTTDPHFEMKRPGSASVDYRIFVDIEFDTLGQNISGAMDDSRRHEVDIVVTTATSGYPRHDEIVLGVECKCVANFSKALVREVLGVRRELSYLTNPPRQSLLTQAGGSPSIQVAANPPSEFRLAYIDPKGMNYEDSPRAFGVDLKHLEP
jgi:hypothetical protein